MDHPHVRYRRTTILLHKTVLPFKEVQLVQTQHHGAKLHKRATYGQKVQYTYISQKQSFYKIELRCDLANYENCEMHRAHVRYRKTTVLQQKNCVYF